jgi:hypothetical protein
MSSERRLKELDKAIAYMQAEQQKLKDGLTKWESVEAIGIDRYHVIRTDKDIPLAALIDDDAVNAKILNVDAPPTHLVRHMRWRHERFIWSRWIKHHNFAEACEFAMDGVRGAFNFAVIDLMLKKATLIAQQPKTEEP